jgi:hypothetical protein
LSGFTIYELIKAFKSTPSTGGDNRDKYFSPTATNLQILDFKAPIKLAANTIVAGDDNNCEGARREH